MTQLVVVLADDIVKTSFRIVEITATRQDDGSGLRSISSAVEGAIAKVWLRVEEIVDTCFQKGWEAGRGLVSDVLVSINEEARNLGNKAAEFRATLLERLRLVTAETLDSVLASMRSEIKIGKLSYRLESIELEHKLVVSTSIEASITALCKFVGSQELVLKGEYGIQH